MPRFPIEREDISKNKVTIAGSDFKHITKVLRLNVGDKISLFDNNSNEYTGEIIEVNSKNLVIKILDSWKAQTESALQIDLYQSVIKPNKMDLIVQKATELGVTNIFPVNSERTQKGLQSKIQRLNKISIESSKQCRRSKPPHVHKQSNLGTTLGNDSYDLKLILYENSEDSFREYISNNNKDLEKISVLIGPEGGFTENEVNLAEKNGYISLSLGKRILRAETAAITIISLIQFKFGDLG